MGVVHTDETGFKRLVLCNVKVQLHETIALVADIEQDRGPHVGPSCGTPCVPPCGPPMWAPMWAPCGPPMYVRAANVAVEQHGVLRILSVCL